MSETSDESRVPKYLKECIQIIHGQSQSQLYHIWLVWNIFYFCIYWEE